MGDGDRLLLSRQASWPNAAGRSSPASSNRAKPMEQTVAREVREETGVRACAPGSARYLASQPWPFPGSLMLGFLADAGRPGSPPATELEDARWFDPRSEAGLANDWAEAAPEGIVLSSPISIAATSSRAWLERDATPCAPAAGLHDHGRCLSPSSPRWPSATSRRRWRPACASSAGSATGCAGSTRKFPEGSLARARRHRAGAGGAAARMAGLLQVALDRPLLGLRRPAVRYRRAVPWCWGLRDLDHDVAAIIDARTPTPAATASCGQSANQCRMDGPSLVEAVFRSAPARWFAVLFWFLLLGPFGALLYRLAALAVDEAVTACRRHRDRRAPGWRCWNSRWRSW